MKVLATATLIVLLSASVRGKLRKNVTLRQPLSRTIEFGFAYILIYITNYPFFIAGLKYDVTVTLLTQDVHVGSNATLGCTINPAPTEPCEYRWSSSQSDVVWTTKDSENGSTLVAAVWRNSTHRIRYFCSVQVRSTLLASGSLLVQVKGVWLLPNYCIISF